MVICFLVVYWPEPGHNMHDHTYYGLAQANTRQENKSPLSFLVFWLNWLHWNSRELIIGCHST